MADPRTVVEINRRRQGLDPTLPDVRFYAFVQHEGDVVITKRHNPHLVVSIGQTFGVAKNFVEPQHVLNLWEKKEGEKHCLCEDGNLWMEKDPKKAKELKDLKLRALQGGQKRKAAEEGGRE